MAFEDNSLPGLRDEINKLDQQLLEILSKRMEIVEKVGEYKKKNQLPALQENRWQEIYNSRRNWAKNMNLSENFVAEIFKLIHQESVNKQDYIKKKLVPQNTDNDYKSC